MFKRIAKIKAKAVKEKLQQLELSRLRREKRRAQNEAEFEGAATAILLAQEQELTLQNSRYKTNT